jgi:TPR repeat protein
MRTAALTGFALISAMLVSAAGPAQTGWRRLLPTVAGDLAITKERAERGDAKAQVELADNLAANLLAAQAVEWYRKAAEQGNVEAKYRLGEILINGSGIRPSPDQRVAPNPTEGVRWTFEAATNFHAGACRNMSYVLEYGVGLDRNLVESYAWLEVFARSNLSDAHAAMDRLALRMDLAEIRESHALAGRFFSREWPHHVTRKFSEADLALKLNGFTIGPVSLAIINGQTLEKGDSVVMPVKDGTARVTCVSISEDSVLVAVEGEEEPRVLRLR